MKILPCHEPSCGNRKLSRGGYYRPATLRDGSPYTLLSWRLPVPTMTYACNGCGRKTTITAQGFRALPTLSLEDLRALKLAHLVEGDLRGADITQEQLDQMEGAGVSVSEMVSE